MLSVAVWITLGACAGWVASILLKTREERSAYANIAASVAGSVAGGVVARHLGLSGPSFEEVLSLQAFLASLVGMSLFLAAVNVLRLWRDAL